MRKNLTAIPLIAISTPAIAITAGATFANPAAKKAAQPRENNLRIVSRT